MVYLLDIYDGILPSDAADKTAPKDSEAFRNYEEERRLFYVAMTRAKDELSLFSIRFRSSVFADELFERDKSMLKSGAKSPPAEKRPINIKEYRAFVKKLTDGTVVEHPKFGVGFIISCDDDVVSINFTDAGVKKIAVHFAFTNSGFRIIKNLS